MTGKIYKWDRKLPRFLRPVINRIFEILTEIQPIDGLGAVVDEGLYGRPISTNPGGRKASGILSNDFDFQMLNASDADGPKVLIRDGVVIGCNDEPIDPSGMPSGDSFVMDVNDDDEIWLVIVWDLETDDSVSGDNILSVDFDHGPSTPDDDELTQYITIGHVSVDPGTNAVSATNEICGDVFIPYPPHLETDAEVELVVDIDTGNIVWKLRHSLTVGDGTTTLDNIDVLTFDSTLFTITDGGGGEVIITLKTTDCSTPPP